MQGLVFSLLFTILVSPFIKKDIPALPPLQTEEIVSEEFLGRIDFDEEGNIVLYHFPKGNIKPAVLFVHKIVFENRKSKYKAFKYLNHNLKIKGNIIKLDNEEFIFVNNVEVLLTEA